LKKLFIGFLLTLSIMTSNTQPSNQSGSGLINVVEYAPFVLFSNFVPLEYALGKWIINQTVEFVLGQDPYESSVGQFIRAAWWIACFARVHQINMHYINQVRFKPPSIHESIDRIASKVLPATQLRDSKEQWETFLKIQKDRMPFVETFKNLRSNLRAMLQQTVLTVGQKKSGTRWLSKLFAWSNFVNQRRRPTIKMYP
jgi:hypothetical protein